MLIRKTILIAAAMTLVTGAASAQQPRRAWRHGSDLCQVRRGLVVRSYWGCYVTKNAQYANQLEVGGGITLRF